MLASDRPEGARQFRRYATRAWTEQLFRDEKGQGFHWEESRVSDPVHALRLVLLLALGTLLALSLGTAGLKRGWSPGITFAVATSGGATAASTGAWG